MIKCFENLYLIILLPDMSPINNEGCSQGLIICILIIVLFTISKIIMLEKQELLLYMLT